MPKTYEPIATQTLGSANAVITFSSIPATYTDLRLSLVANAITSTAQGYTLRFNGDTAGNYSFTTFIGWSGNSVAALPDANQTFIRLSGRQIAPSTTMPSFSLVDIMNYTSTSLTKAILATVNESKDATPSNVIKLNGLWRSTSAINSITLTASASFPTGTIATIYGIKAA
jgi:hypothetical protein